MYRHKISTALFLVLSLVYVSGCGDEGNNQNLAGTKPRGQSNISPLDYRCVAEATPSIVNAATSRYPAPDQTITLRVHAYNGSGRYRIPRYINEFASSATHTGGYYNWTNQNTIRGAVVNVVDIVTGKVTQCNFSVTVRPASRPEFTVANNFPYCSITGSDSPVIGTATTYEVHVANVAQPFTYSDFMLDYQEKTTVEKVSDLKGKATVTFQYPGLQKAFVDILKDGRIVGYCEKLVMARYPSSVTLVASSEVSTPGAEASKSITVEAFPHNFVSAPDISFTVDRPEITLVKTGNKVTVNSNLAQTVKLTATATLGSDTATASVTLVFGDADPNALNCRITHTVDSDGKTVRFNIAPVGETGSLVVSEFNHDGVLTSGLSQQVVVRYDNHGFKTVSAKAHLAGNESRRCNAGNHLFDSVTIGMMGCSVFTSPNPSPVNGKVLATVLPFGTNYSSLRIKTIASTAGSSITQGASHGDLTREITFTAAGNYTVDVVVEDPTTGITATCSSRHVVTSQLPQCLATFYYGDNTQVTSPRIREDVFVRIDSSLRYGFVQFFPGGETFSSPGPDNVWFPALSRVALSYKTPGFKNASFLVAGPTGYATMCSAALSVQEGLACTVKTTERKSLEIETAITNLSDSGMYVGGSTSVTHEVQVTNSKPPVVYSLTGDGLSASTSSSATISYNRHGAFNISASVKDSKDARGSSCSAVSTIDLVQKVTIVQPTTYASGNSAATDSATVKFENASSSTVSVILKVISEAATIEETLVVPANGNITSQSFKRNTATGLFDISITVAGDQPKTGDNLKATINATIDGALKTFRLNPL